MGVSSGQKATFQGALSQREVSGCSGFGSPAIRPSGHSVRHPQAGDQDLSGLGEKREGARLLEMQDGSGVADNHPHGVYASWETAHRMSSRMKPSANLARLRRTKSRSAARTTSASDPNHPVLTKAPISAATLSVSST